jgi:hypothetical protein
MTVTLVIFHASQKPVNGLYNWIEYRDLDKKPDCKLLQKIVDGPITLLPNILYEPESIFECYANDEGLLRSDLGRGDLSGCVLHRLGFRGCGILGYSYAGTVVAVLSRHQKKAAKQRKMIEDAILAYQHDQEDEEDSEDVPPDTKKETIPDQKEC